MKKKQELYKVIIYVPQTQLEQVRTAAHGAGAGVISKYDHCSFISHGIGTYRPLKGSKPSQGSIGNIERIGEAKLEVTVIKDKVKKVVSAVKKVHPYEEPVIDIYKLESF